MATWVGLGHKECCDMVDIAVSCGPQLLLFVETW